ncbi:MAG TPA: nucleotidyltransferase family protein [Gammaproteobacteria bacterium]|nr:nucleotidyltransferase family protein [Gammaproteobacteria bacterium]
MILAAGRGERLRPLTDHLPKPLIKIGDRCLIEHHLVALAQAGVDQVVINLDHLGDMIESHIGDGKRYGLSVVYSREPEGALDTGGGIRRALRLITTDPFVVLNSDIWTDLYLDSLPDGIDGQGHLLLVDNPVHNPAGDFHLLGQKVLNQPVGNSVSLTFSGIGIYRHSLFNDSPRGRFPLAGLLRQAADGNQLSGQHFSGQWIDVGTVDRLFEARRIANAQNNPR